jgi:1-phosphatidylinositol phosphodiesterase
MVAMALLVLFSLFLPGTAAANWRNLPQWMWDYPDNTWLGSMTLPGSHESGATVEPVAGTAQCQSLSIFDQLNSGVRFLDIRCRHYNDSFVIHHGSVYQHLNFDDVLVAVTTFLHDNPSETVLLSVKEEYTASGNTRPFTDTMIAYLNNTNYANYFWRGGASSPWCKDYLPTLGEVRGKIILVRRFASFSGWGGTGGIDLHNWPDNWAGTYNGAYIQDYYQVSSQTDDHKIAAINDTLTFANQNPGTWTINFSSGVTTVLGVPNIPKVSGPVNNWLSWRFQNPATNGVGFGTILSDFIDSNTIAGELYATESRLPWSGGTFTLQNRADGECLDNLGQTANGAAVAQWGLSGSANQQWYVEPVDGTWIKLRNVATGAYLDSLGQTADASTLSQWSGSGSWNQQWQFQQATPGYFQIINRATGKAVDTGGQAGNGVSVQMYNQNSSWNQQWRYY